MKPGNPFTHIFDGLKGRLHVSMVMLLITTTTCSSLLFESSFFFLFFYTTFQAWNLAKMGIAVRPTIYSFFFSERFCFSAFG